MVTRPTAAAAKGASSWCRAQDYQTVDTWQVAGLQGTGSWDIILDDVFVPAYRTQRMPDNFLLKGPGRR